MIKNLKKIYGSRYLELSVRLGIGVVFLLAGIGKVTGGAHFLYVVTSLKILPFYLIEPVGVMLPWLELVLGICFILGLCPGIAAAISIPLVSGFIVVNVFNLQRGLASPCGSCFGNLLALTSRDALIVDGFLLLAAIRVLIVQKPFMNLGSFLSQRITPMLIK